MGAAYSSFVSPDVTPIHTNPPTFDSQQGFENGRIERKMIATQEEMEAAMIPPDQQDYCAHHLIDYYKCRRDRYPLVIQCKPERHAWDECQFSDHVLRMKEYERERRLLERAKRKAKKASAENME